MINVEQLKTGLRTCLLEVNAEMSDVDASVDNVFHFLEHQYFIRDRKGADPDPVNHDVIAYFDGNGNREMTGLAQFRVEWPDGTIIPGSLPMKGKTNNELEYTGLILALRHLLEAKPPNGGEMDVFIKGDSKLVINQTKGIWRVREKHLVPLRDECVHLMSLARKEYNFVVLNWCPSSENLVDAHA